MSVKRIVKLAPALTVAVAALLCVDRSPPSIRPNWLSIAVAAAPAPGGPVESAATTPSATETPALSAADAYEPDDRPEDAHAIRCAEVQAHEIEPLGDEDWVEFELGTMTGVVVQTGSALLVDTVLQLTDHAGATIDVNDDNIVTGALARIDRPCGISALPTGVYRTQVTAYRHASTFPYTIELECHPCGEPNATATPSPTPGPVPSADAFEPDNRLEDARLIGCGETQDRWIDPSSDEDWIQFAVGRLTGVEIATSGSLVADTVLELTDSDGALIEFNDDSIDFFARIVRPCGLDALPAGSYRARVTSFGAGSIFPYRLALRCEPCGVPNATPTPTLPPDAFEPDDRPDLAKPIRCGDVQSHTFVPSFDTDWVEFVLDAMTEVVLDATSDAPSGLPPLITLFNADFGTAPVSGGIGRVEHRCGADALAPGTYFVNVSPYSPDQGSGYELGLSCSPCDIPNPTVTATATATPVPTPDARGNHCASNADCSFFDGECACCADNTRRCSLFCFPGDCTSPIALCAGDCNGDGHVRINEIISCAQQVGGPAEQCPACDVDGNGTVTIDEVIAVVGAASRGCGTGPPSGHCGDGVVQTCDGPAPDCEQCDDGNNFGGDGCAANCTIETRYRFAFGGTDSFIDVVAPFGTLPLSPFQGEMTLVLGAANGDGTIPVVVPANELRIDPIPFLLQIDPTTFLNFCACVVGVDVHPFAEQIGFDADAGPGNTIDGTIGCGPEGLSAANYGNVAAYNANDEGRPRRASELRGSGHGQPGSARLRGLIDLGLITGDCSSGDGNPAKGPDGIPCTADDSPIFGSNVVALTTGNASGAVLGTGSRPELAVGCRGDCDGDGTVGAFEIVRAIRAAGAADCPLADADGNGRLTADEVEAIARETFGCGDRLLGRQFDCAAIANRDESLDGALTFAIPVPLSNLGFPDVIGGRLSAVTVVSSRSPTATRTASATPSRTSTATGTATITPTPVPGVTEPTSTFTAMPSATATAKKPPPGSCYSNADCTDHPGDECYCCYDHQRRCYGLNGGHCARFPESYCGSP